MEIVEKRENGFTMQDNEFREYDVFYNDYLDIITIMKVSVEPEKPFRFINHMHIGGINNLYSDDNISSIIEYIDEYEIARYRNGIME